jgi:hypothetical protein
VGSAGKGSSGPKGSFLLGLDDLLGPIGGLNDPLGPIA